MIFYEIKKAVNQSDLQLFNRKELFNLVLRQ
jgi:hypothetical protein